MWIAIVVDGVCDNSLAVRNLPRFVEYAVWKMSPIHAARSTTGFADRALSGVHHARGVLTHRSGLRCAMAPCSDGSISELTNGRATAIAASSPRSADSNANAIHSMSSSLTRDLKGGPLLVVARLRSSHLADGAVFSLLRARRGHEPGWPNDAPHQCRPLDRIPGDLEALSLHRLPLHHPFESLMESLGRPEFTRGNDRTTGGRRCRAALFELDLPPAERGPRSAQRPILRR